MILHNGVIDGTGHLEWRVELAIGKIGIGAKIGRIVAGPTHHLDGNAADRFAGGQLKRVVTDAVQSNLGFYPGPGGIGDRSPGHRIITLAGAVVFAQLEKTGGGDWRARQVFVLIEIIKRFIGGQSNREGGLARDSRE